MGGLGVNAEIFVGECANYVYNLVVASKRQSVFIERPCQFGEAVSI
jgi:hypothetical protein